MRDEKKRKWRGIEFEFVEVRLNRVLTLSFARVSFESGDSRERSR